MEILAFMRIPAKLNAYSGGNPRRSGNKKSFSHNNCPEVWIAADPFKHGFRVLITGPHGFERTVTFAIDEDPSVIAVRVRETLDVGLDE